MAPLPGIESNGAVARDRIKWRRCRGSCACHIEYEIIEEAMNFMSYEHLVEECPIIQVVREMFGDCNTYNSNWRDHPNFSWKPQPPQYKQPTQAPQQASNLEQAMVNLSKVVGDFVLAQKSINAHLSQRIDSIESSLNKRMDEVQNDLSQKIDNLQYSISRLTNLKAHKRESSQVRDVKVVITLSSKEVDLATSKQEHETENEIEKKKREEIKGKRKGIVSIALIQCKSLMKDASFIWDPGKLKQDNIF
uniref:Uncharacterized protein n=1 Tax=Vitis vinifera TaxID=29760 RepID=A5BY40_VITVI|nr:hypothetical protein VITISV_044210 [Vitis vinifera]